MWCFWAAKGGAGTSVTVAGIALSAGTAERNVLVVDLAGDLPAVFGIPTPDAGIAEWTAEGEGVPVDALDRLRTPVAPGVSLLAAGDGPLVAGRIPALVSMLRRQTDLVVVDAGTSPSGARAEVVRSSDRSVLVTRACYLAIDRARRSDLRPTDAVLVREGARALDPKAVASALEVPIQATIRHDAGVARAVDAGLLARRLPRALRVDVSRLAA